METTKRRKKGVKRPPTCAAILLCDDVVRDQFTQKSSVIGTFDTFVLSEVPGETAPCTIFLRLLDAIGEESITVEIHDQSAGSMLFRSPSAVKTANRPKNTPREIRLEIPPLLFESEGVYDMVVLADGAEIGRVQFNIQRRVR
jgi:hypothetical protein